MPPGAEYKQQSLGRNVGQARMGGSLGPLLPVGVTRGNPSTSAGSRRCSLSVNDKGWSL